MRLDVSVKARTGSVATVHSVHAYSSLVTQQANIGIAKRRKKAFHEEYIFVNRDIGIRVRESCISQMDIREAITVDAAENVSICRYAAFRCKG